VGIHRIIPLVLVLSLVVSACGGTSAAEISDGSFRAFAVADGEVPDLSLSIDGDVLSFSSSGEDVEATLAADGDTYPVCGTDREDEVFEVGTTITVGDAEYTSPGLFGDCGVTTPVRVTLVDLDSFDDDLGVVPFARWVELCDTTDPDC
jgi:hypothetical protein